MWPLMMAKIFGPKSAPAKFDQFPKEMAYAELKMPVVIIAGEDDRLIDIDKQSARLHSDVSQSAFHRVPQTGHMIHQTATGEVMAAINEVAGNGP